jgi:hypothetical protein
MSENVLYNKEICKAELQCSLWSAVKVWIYSFIFWLCFFFKNLWTVDIYLFTKLKVFFRFLHLMSKRMFYVAWIWKHKKCKPFDVGRVIIGGHNQIILP